VAKKKKKSSSAAQQAPRDAIFKIALQGGEDGDEMPKLVAIAVDTAGRAIESARVSDAGEARISRKAFDQSARIMIGAAGSEPDDDDAEFVSLHRFQVAKAIEENRAIELARRSWLPFLVFRRCIDGRARHCELGPFLTELRNIRLQRLAVDGVVQLAGRSITLDSVIEPVPAFLKRCKPLCDGVVEVYRRTCCCFPIVIYDPRIPEIIRDLEELVEVLPPIGPVPDPPFFDELPFLKSGAKDQRAINAEVDLKALESLPASELPAYIQARPYLFCTCGAPTLVASGFLQPDGEFDICWNERLRLLWLHCHDEYAFRIKQLVDGGTVTVYDGVAAGQWFESNEQITLTTYHPDAIVCDPPADPPPGVGTTSVFLEAIGSTPSEHLNAPVPDGWDRVPTPVGEQGTAFPAPVVPGAVQYKNVGWGKTLPLRYLFFDDLEPIATFYRISVAKADASGHPMGPRMYLDAPLSWIWNRRRVDLTIKKEIVDLGPVPASANLYRIPYRSLFQALLAPGEIGEWGFGQFHGLVDTLQWGNGRHLITIELFDAAQNQIKPPTAPAADPGTPAPFSFQSWDQSNLSATVPVDFAALTHLFWWDNRHTDAAILAVNKNGAPFVDECLFLEGPRNTNVSVEYRAEHQDPRFLYWHDVRWKRGLFTPWQTWVPPNPASLDPGTTPNRTYDQLLGTEDKCAFTVEVRTRAKIFSGAGRIFEYDDRDDGAFAIISPAS
jgi:hypothetical protein